jgi:hypothetical protein
LTPEQTRQEPADPPGKPVATSSGPSVGERATTEETLRAEVVSIGDELTTGQRLDTNSQWISRELGVLGVPVAFHTKITDSLEDGIAAFRIAAERAEIIREKGTNRSQFFRGQVDKYTWVDIGSSYLPGELIAAFLWAQMEEAEAITAKRLDIWNHYHSAFHELEEAGLVCRPVIPSDCRHNAHMYYVLNESPMLRDDIIESLREQGIHSVFHYVPLHTSPFGSRYASENSYQAKLPVTDHVARSLIRLPLWIGLSKAQQRQATKALHIAVAGGPPKEIYSPSTAIQKGPSWMLSSILPAGSR